MREIERGREVGREREGEGEREGGREGERRKRELHLCSSIVFVVKQLVIQLYAVRQGRVKKIVCAVKKNSRTIGTLVTLTVQPPHN